MIQAFETGVRLGVMAMGAVVGFCGMFTLGAVVVAIATAAINGMIHKK